MIGGQVTGRQFPPSDAADTSSAAPSTDADPALHDKFTLLPLRVAVNAVGIFGQIARSVGSPKQERANAAAVEILSLDANKSVSEVFTLCWHSSLH